jgi:hypothetical protein
VLHPKISYVSNIGFSGNGENCTKGGIMGGINNKLDLDVTSANEDNNELALKRLRTYFKKRYSFVEKSKRKIKSYL